MNNSNTDSIDQNLLLEQYKMYVETAEQVTNRRQILNKYYIAALTSLIGIPYALEIKILEDVSFLTLFIGGIGLILAFLWEINLFSAKQINGAKFKIIQDMERNLPYACYTNEWIALEEGQNSEKYLPATSIELFIPIIMGSPYLFLVFYSLYVLLL